VDEGHPEPEFEEDHGTFIVRFIPRTPLGRTASSKDLRVGLSKRQQRILELLKAGPLSPAQLLSNLKTTQRTLERELRVLRSRGLIAREGPNQSIVWRLMR